MIRFIRLILFPCLLISCILLSLAACQLSAQPTLPQSNIAASPSKSPGDSDVTLDSISPAAAQPSPAIPITATPFAIPSVTLAPTKIPTAMPTSTPTNAPTTALAPTKKPSPTPTKEPSPTPTKKPSPTPTPGGIQIHLSGVPGNWPLSASQQSRVDHFIELVNKARSDAGVPALGTGGSKLREMAAIRAAEISILFSHSRPTQDTNSDHWSELLKALGISYSIAGENITGGPGTPEAALTTFMNSGTDTTGHRGNILNPKFTTIAIGVYTDGSGKDWWSQEFIG